MLDTHIKIMETSKTKDRLNQVVGSDVLVAELWATKTESGGRESVYASRIVNEGEVVYTVRWRDDIKAGQFIIDGERRSKIIFPIQEGRQKWLHLKCTLTNAKG